MHIYQLAAPHKTHAGKMDKPQVIAIIEDEPAIRMLYQKKFELEGFVTITANDGYEGLSIIKKSKPDLVLLDLRMPRMNGDEMLVKLRSEDWGTAVRVIILTNLSRSEAPQSLRFLNINRYVIKAHHTPKQIVDIAREVLA